MEMFNFDESFIAKHATAVFAEVVATPQGNRKATKEEKAIAASKAVHSKK